MFVIPRANRKPGVVDVTSGDKYSVTVSRINEGMRDEPYVAIPAKRVTLDSDGTLRIESEGYGRTISASLWDGFEVKRLPPSS